MKNTYTYFIKCLIFGILCLPGILLQAQPTASIKSSIWHGGLLRNFSFYVPKSYQANKATALVFNLHGYTSNGDQQEFYGDFRKIADTAGFIIVHPDGTINSQTQQRFWNVGLVGSSNVDDVGFIHALIDTLSSAYRIDPNRIYSTGMSNGGFMSYHLACNSTRFAAIASVTGSMTLLTQASCRNAAAIPIMEIHGDADPVVPYNGMIGVLSVPDVLQYWVQKNKLDPSKKTTQAVPDINITDNAKAEYIYYPGPAPVAHYKVLNGAHTWPGAIIPIGVTCQDFNASEVIWNFFSRFSKTTVEVKNSYYAEGIAVPNPAEDELYLKNEDEYEGSCDLKIMSLDGKILVSAFYPTWPNKIKVNQLASGTYILLLQNAKTKYRIKFNVI